MWASLVIFAALLPNRLAVADANGAPRPGPAAPGDPAYWVKLAGFTPSAGELTPAFEPDIADYTLLVANPELLHVIFSFRLNLIKYTSLGMPTLLINNEPFKYSAIDTITKEVSLNETVPFDQTLSITIADPAGPQGFLVKTTRSFTYNIRIRQPALYKKVVLMESLYITGCSDQPDSVCKLDPGEAFTPDKDVIKYSVPSTDSKLTIHYKCNELAVPIFRGDELSKNPGTIDLSMDRYLVTEDISCRYVEKVKEFGLSTKDKMYTISLLQPTPLNAETLHLNLRMLPRFGYCRMENSLKDPRWVCRGTGTETGFVSTYTDSHATVFLVNPDGTKRYKFELGIPTIVQLPPPEKNKIAWNLEVQGGVRIMSFPVEIKIAAQCSTLVCPRYTKPKTFENSGQQAHLCDGSPCNVAADAAVCCEGSTGEWDRSWYKIEDLVGDVTNLVPNLTNATLDTPPKPLSATDLAKVAERLKIDVTKADIDAMIVAVDGRGADNRTDEAVDRAELGAMIARIGIDKELVELFKTEVKFEGDAEKAWNILNANGDKGVSIAELEAAMKRPELSQAHARTSNATEIINRVDVDHDGFLSREELNVLVKRYAGEHTLYELSLAARWETDKEAAGVEDHPIQIVVPAKVEPAKPKALTTIEMIVRDLDVTGDNKVRASGLLVWAKRSKKEGAGISEADLKTMVDEVDKNKDGGLEPAEFAAVVMTTEGHETKLFKWLGAGIHKIQALDAITRLLQDLVPVEHSPSSAAWLGPMRTAIAHKAKHFYNYGCDPAVRTECAGETYYYDPECSDPNALASDGNLGCWAAGINANCRFCGFDQYRACPTSQNAMAQCFTAPCKKWTREHADWCKESFGVTCPEHEPSDEEWMKLHDAYSHNYDSCHAEGNAPMGMAKSLWGKTLWAARLARRFEDKAKPAEAESSPWRRLVSSAVLGFGLLATAVFAGVSLKRRRSQVGGARYFSPAALTEYLAQE